MLVLPRKAPYTRGEGESHNTIAMLIDNLIVIVNLMPSPSGISDLPPVFPRPMSIFMFSHYISCLFVCLLPSGFVSLLGLPVIHIHGIKQIMKKSFR